jgi:hypothetical protein
MAPDRLCPQCGCLLPPGLVQGTCPACLLGVGLQSPSEPPAGPLDGAGNGDHQAATGFQPAGAGTVLETLAHSIGPIPRLLLPDTDTDDVTGAVQITLNRSSSGYR